MLTAADVMTKDVITVGPEAPVREVAKLMHAKRISGVPVVDLDKRVIGIVGEGDLIKHAELVGETRRPWWIAAFSRPSVLAHDYIRTHGRTAGEVMAAPVITVAPTASLAECAKIMTRHRLKRLLVVESGNLVGIVTRGDLLQALMTTDASQSPSVDDGAIRERLLSKVETQRWAHVLRKDIIVKNGVVDIRGVVETEDERHAWRVAAQDVPGVKRVEDHMRMRPLFQLG